MLSANVFVQGIYDKKGAITIPGSEKHHTESLLGRPRRLSRRTLQAGSPLCGTLRLRQDRRQHAADRTSEFPPVRTFLGGSSGEFPLAMGQGAGVYL